MKFQVAKLTIYPLFNKTNCDHLIYKPQDTHEVFKNIKLERFKTQIWVKFVSHIFDWVYSFKKIKCLTRTQWCISFKHIAMYICCCLNMLYETPMINNSRVYWWRCTTVVQKVWLSSIIVLVQHYCAGMYGANMSSSDFVNFSWGCGAFIGTSYCTIVTSDTIVPSSGDPIMHHNSKVWCHNNSTMTTVNIGKY